MAYNENINLFVTTDRNNADVFNAPLEKIIQNIQDTREYLYQLQAELDQLEFRMQSEYTPTEQLNDLLANGVKGDKGDNGESLEYNWDGTALGVKLESESDFTYRDLKGEPGDVSTEQLEEALTDYPTLEYLGEVKTDLENEIANIPKVTKTSELTNDSGYITASDIPVTLPANGGNSDTVDGKHAVDFVQATNAFIGTQDFNTYESTKTWSALTKATNAQNAPYQYSTVFNVGANDNANFQMAHSYSNTSQFWVRGRHDISGNYTPWAEVYTTENKPTASEVGALASNGTAVNASKVNNALTLQIAGATKNTFNGSSAQTFNIPNASTSAPGVMTAAQVTKLNGIATGATKNTIDTAMSSTSANAVQNKVIYAYIQQQINNLANGGISVVKSVQRGVSTIESGDSYRDIRITAVNVNKAMANYLGFTGDSYSTSSYHRDRGYISLVDSTTLRISRRCDDSNCTYSWEVIEFY